MHEAKTLNTSGYPEIPMKQINLKLPDKLIAAAQRYVKSYGYRNIQELAAESLREKVFRHNSYDDTFSDNEIGLIDQMIEKSLSRKQLGKEEDLIKALR